LLLIYGQIAFGDDPGGHSAMRAVPPDFAGGAELADVVGPAWVTSPLLLLFDDPPHAAAVATTAITPAIATSLRVLLTAIKPSP